MKKLYTRLGIENPRKEDTEGERNSFLDAVYRNSGGFGGKVQRYIAELEQQRESAIKECDFSKVSDIDRGLRLAAFLLHYK